MTTFVVRAIYSGTKKDLAISARNAQIALCKAQRSKQTKGASCFIVYHRKFSGIPILTKVN